MKIVPQSVEILTPIDGDKALRFITEVGYVSHGTKKDIAADTAQKFVKRHCIESKPEHGTLLEFVDITVKIITDRAIANELVRHRIAVYNQKSSRYVDEKELEVVEPIGLKEKYPKAYFAWYNTCSAAEDNYHLMRYDGATPEEARDVLPLSTATEIVMKLNIRSWRNFFGLRNHKLAHPKMRVLAGMILEKFQRMIPVVFDDFEVWKDDSTM